MLLLSQAHQTFPMQVTSRGQKIVCAMHLVSCVLCFSCYGFPTCLLTYLTWHNYWTLKDFRASATVVLKIIWVYCCTLLYFINRNYVNRNIAHQSVSTLSQGKTLQQCHLRKLLCYGSYGSYGRHNAAYEEPWKWKLLILTYFLVSSGISEHGNNK